MNDERFNQLLEQMRDEGAPPDQISDAKDRVWHRLTASQSPACEELRAELGAYVDGRLSEPRRLLIHDHVSRCLHCRHTLAEIKGEPKLVSFPVEATRRWRRPTRWAIAAGIVLAVLYVGRSSIDSALAPGGPRATVVSVSGTLVDLSNGFGVAGMELADGTTVRTAAGSRAMLRLDDGSMVEMNERTELSVRGAWSGNTIRLERGDIVVEAAAQGRGRLRVVTRDSIASVRGTVFAVSRATTGSLVSVVEGSVEVSQPGYQELLIAGQQAATTAALGKVGMTEEVGSSAYRTYVGRRIWCRHCRPTPSGISPSPTSRGPLARRSICSTRARLTTRCWTPPCPRLRARRCSTCSINCRRSRRCSARRSSSC